MKGRQRNQFLSSQSKSIQLPFIVSVRASADYSQFDFENIIRYDYELTRIKSHKDT